VTQAGLTSPCPLPCPENYSKVISATTDQAYDKRIQLDKGKRVKSAPRIVSDWVA